MLVTPAIEIWSSADTGSTTKICILNTIHVVVHMFMACVCRPII
jgi:hypothetical protein